QEECDLPDRRNAVGRFRWRNQCERDEICADEPDHVSAEQQAPHEPTPAPPRREPTAIDLIHNGIALRNGDRVLRYNAQTYPLPQHEASRTSRSALPKYPQDSRRTRSFLESGPIPYLRLDDPSVAVLEPQALPSCHHQNRASEDLEISTNDLPRT